MAETAISGPLIVFGQSPYPAIEYNPDLGTSLFWGGAAILDPRTAFTYLTGQAQSAIDYGFLGFDNVTSLSAVPYTSTTGAIVASANPTSATLSLVTANSATTGVYVTQTFVRSDTNVVDNNSGAGLIALDAYTSVTASFSNGVMTVTANSAMPIGPGMVVLSTTGTLSQGAIAGTTVQAQITTTGTASSVGQGQTGTYQVSTSNLTAASGTVTLAYPNVQACAVLNVAGTPTLGLWSAPALVGRAVAVFAATSATYTTATVSGYDIYGYPMVEAITLSANSAVSGKKAFKYIKSVVLSGGTADTTHAYRVDTTSVVGLPIRSDTAGEVIVNAGASQVATAGNTAFAANGFLPADRTTPSATTGDVRGTIDLGNASGVNLVPSTGTNKYVFRQSPQAYNVSSATGLFGLAQYSNF